VLAAGGVLATTGVDGRLTAVPVGATDFLGNPS
jgi:hypothetical protein